MYTHSGTAYPDELVLPELLDEELPEEELPEELDVAAEAEAGDLLGRAMSFEVPDEVTIGCSTASRVPFKDHTAGASPCACRDLTGLMR